jgi:hypothetical protein
MALPQATPRRAAVAEMKMGVANAIIYCFVGAM